VPEQAPMANAFDPSDLDSLTPRTRDLIQRRDAVLGPGYRLFYREPVTVVRGSGAHLFDEQGNDYLDAYNNVPSVGHCHPYVTEAAHRQLQMVNTNTRYVQELLVSYAERLLGFFPAELARVTFTCTGSEANDLALRVARFHTGHQGVIVTDFAYHGLTAAVAELSPSLGAGSPLGPHVRTIAAPDARAAPGGDVAAYVRAEIKRAIGDLERHGYGLAAFFADSIFSSDGLFPDPAGFLRPVLAEVHAAGGIYVADEVQPGFGRLGTEWWGFARHGVVPDLVTLGKPMGNGLPISAVVFRPELTELFGRQVRYFNTFGGSSVPIAAANAVLDVLIAEKLPERAADVGAALLAGTREILGPTGALAEARGAGLYVGAEIAEQPGAPAAAVAAAIVNDLRARRVLISASGPGSNVLKIRPPLAFDAADLDRFLDTLQHSARAVLG
jgi:4-aminobutyrate aminotransferase-like enzyme